MARDVGAMLPAKPQTYGDRFLAGLGKSIVRLAADNIGATDAAEKTTLQALTLETAWERQAATRNVTTHQTKMHSTSVKADEKLRQAAVAVKLRDSRDFENLEALLTSDERERFNRMRATFRRETCNADTAKERAEAFEKFGKAFGEFRSEVIVRIAKSPEATDAATADAAK